MHFKAEVQGEAEGEPEVRARSQKPEGPSQKPEGPGSRGRHLHVTAPLPPPLLLGRPLTSLPNLGWLNGSSSEASGTGGWCQ